MPSKDAALTAAFFAVAQAAVFTDTPQSCLSVDFGPPPAHADEQETPVLKKLGRFAFERMPDELEYPSQNKKTQGVGPQPMHKDGTDKNEDGNENCRNTQGVAGSVYRMPMAGGVLGDPLLAGAVA